MSKWTLGLIASAALLPGYAVAQTAPTPPQLTPAEAALRGHVAYLASDELRGRLPGTEGYAKAAAYAARQMEAAGLQPGGDGGSWYQKVPLVATSSTGTPDMALDGQSLIFNKDFATWPTPGLRGAVVDAPVVFAGYGIVDPVTGRDDYRGLDVRGKIVALFVSGPKGIDSDVAAGMTWYLERPKVAKARGAVGVIYLHTKVWEPLLPFEFLAPIFESSQTTWRDARGTPDLGVPRLGILSADGARKLFARFGKSWDEIRTAEDAGQPVPTGSLDIRMASHQAYATTQVASMNVIGRLPGSDPRLRAETIVMTGHLDHVGTIAPVNGDEIANGAMDNAMGSAVVLDTAKEFQTNGARPKRSILFVTLTAEESGLTGSDYFVHHPTVPAKDIVANVNVDCPVLTYRFEDVVAIGAERSTIGPIVKAVVASAGFELVPPSQQGAGFTRSDQFNFAKIGVPVIYLSPGPKGPGLAAHLEYSKHHYHTPFDDLSQPFDWTAARAYVKLNYNIIRQMANASQRPLWVKGDYFGSLYHGPMMR